MLGLLPEEFGALTPGEFGELLEHAAYLEDRAWDRTATTLMHLCNAITGDATRLADYLPKAPAAPRPARDGREELRQLRAQFADPAVSPVLT